MSDKQTIVGTCQGVSQRPGSDWVTFEIGVPGKQYPVKLSTKLEPLIEKAKGIGQGVATWEYTEQESDKINEHTGKPYVNRYLSGVEIGAEAPAQTPQQYVQSNRGDKGDVDWDAKERRDYRSRAWAQTISAMSHTIKVEESAGDIYRRLYALQRMIYRDIVRELDSEAFPDDDLPFA